MDSLKPPSSRGPLTSPVVDPQAGLFSHRTNRNTPDMAQLRGRGRPYSSSHSRDAQTGKWHAFRCIVDWRRGVIARRVEHSYGNVVWVARWFLAFHPWNDATVTPFCRTQILSLFGNYLRWFMVSPAQPTPMTQALIIPQLGGLGTATENVSKRALGLPSAISAYDHQVASHAAFPAP
ncbi:hypothetical protein K461DRAFT_266510 [Myriangium duriaei CBS 260.36]|uniref:Uncharacterized protein n=1 Tax=Myriangium duriaei CBS 260.36 TaxID=1168546 RepID=A0A9P4JA29_9PEZI|nr:hypothetical protein K461DRAFT_266510 [Myriangium duriaei CBS 260.36]